MEWRIATETTRLWLVGKNTKDVLIGIHPKTAGEIDGRPKQGMLALSW